MSRARGWIGAFALCGGLAGCGEATNLYVAHNTVVGVNANVSPDRQQGQLLVGYDRDFITIIPKSVDADGLAPGEQDVMSLLNCTELEVDGIFLSRYVDVMASGEAAKKLAAALSDGDVFFDCKERAALAAAPGQGGEDAE